MKLILAVLLAFSVAACAATTPTKAVTQEVTSKAVTDSIVIPSGQSITINPGATITNNGTAVGFGSGSPGTGTVTSVSITTANGISGTVANSTTTPAITLSLGAITPSSIAATGNITGLNLSGTNTGDQTTITGNAGTATALQTARLINGVSFNGTSNITITAAGSTLSDTVPIAKGGTGATTAANARTALGLEINTDIQAYNANITTIAALADSAGVLTNDGAGAFSYKGTSTGGNGSADEGKLAMYSDGNGTLYVATKLSVQPSEFGLAGNYVDLTPGSIKWVNSNSAGGETQLYPRGTSGIKNIRLPNASGDLALTTDDITGTAAGLSSTLAVSSGGTGQTTYTNGQILIGNTTGNTLTKATLTAGTGISITNGSGSITIAATGAGTGTVTSVAASVPSFLSVTGSPITTSGTLAISYSGTPLPVANGGTGITSFGTGIATALGVNVGSAGAPVLYNGDGGTPSTITLTNAVGSASGLTSGVSLTTVALATTGASVNVSSAAPPTSGKVLTATGATTATWQTPATGKIAQVIFTSDGTSKSTTSAIPLDNTIPQSGEGAAYTELDTTITPTNASSTLLIRVNLPISASTASAAAAALFRDSGADALRTGWTSIGGAGNLSSITIETSVAASSTSATTFKIRFGSIGPGTININTSNGTAYFNGTIKATMTITEILP